MTLLSFNNTAMSADYAGAQTAQFARIERIIEDSSREVTETLATLRSVMKQSQRRLS